MKTLNKNTKLTSAELELLTDLFNNGSTLYRKVVLFGSGHPQLPKLFATNLDNSDNEEFWKDHETTHAKFIAYNSIEDMKQDKDLWRSDLTCVGQELDDIDIYN